MRSVQSIVWSAELYSAEPKPTFGITLAVLGGTGIFSSTFCADTCLLKFAITLMLIFSVVSLYASRPARAPTISSYTGRMRNGRLMFSVTRYFISSNSPSGGMNVIVRS